MVVVSIDDIPKEEATEFVSSMISHHLEHKTGDHEEEDHDKEMSFDFFPLVRSLFMKIAPKRYVCVCMCVCVNACISVCECMYKCMCMNV